MSEGILITLDGEGGGVEYESSMTPNGSKRGISSFYKLRSERYIQSNSSMKKDM